MSGKFFLVLLLSVVLYAANLWGISVYILDEAKNAGCAMEMHQHKEWVVPTFNGMLRTDKPVLHYYFMKISYAIIGVSPLAARLFSAVMGVLTLFSVFWFVRRIVNEEVAFYACLILLASLQLTVQFHLAVPDPYLIFFLTSGWLSFYYAWRTDQKKFFYFFYACMSFGALTKGPVAVVFSGLIVAAFLLVQRKFTLAELRRIRLPEGLAIFCLLTLPWYIAVGVQTEGEWLNQFLFRHNMSRFTKTMEGHGGFPFASVVIAVAALMPFSFFFPQMFRKLWREHRQDPFIRFCFITMSVVIVFFAFSKTILPSYPEPALPFFAIMLACYFCTPEDRHVRYLTWISGTVYLLIMLVVPAAVYTTLRKDSSLSDLAPLSGYFFILPLGAGLALRYLSKDRLKAALHVYAGSSIIFLLVFFYIIFPEVDKRNPVLLSQSVFKEPKPVVYYKDINPAYVFLFQQSIPKLDSPEELAAFMKRQDNFYLISQKKYWHELEQAGVGLKILFEGRDLFEEPVTIVMEGTRYDLRGRKKKLSSRTQR